MSAALSRYASETVTHGIVHLTGKRRVYVKVIWLAAILVSACYCAFKVQMAYLKFVRREITSSIKANELIFEFPDVYFCPLSPISGSYSVTLGIEDSQLLKKYRALVNASMASMASKDKDQRSQTYVIRLVNTLPYQFLADKMAHQMRQFVINFFLNGDQERYLNLIPFYHPYMLNCVRYNLSEASIRTLLTPSNSIYTAFFLDPQLPPPFDNSTDRDTAFIGSMTMDLKPRAWDMHYGIDSSKPSGLQVIMTPRGHYPSYLDTTLNIGSGMVHRIGIKMQDTIYDDADTCEDNGVSTADFLDPYSGEKISFKNSRSVCWYGEIARLSQRNFSCSPLRLPVPWEYRSLPSCYNLTEFPANLSLSPPEYNHLSDIIQQATKVCLDKVPCRRRSYTFEYSASSTATEYDWNRYYRASLIGLVNGSTPGLSYLVHNSSFQWARDSLVQVEMFSTEYKCPEFHLSLGYNFDSLIADVGGLLGLFLGVSLLSVLELLELLHDCVLDAWKAVKLRTAANSVRNHKQQDGVENAVETS